MAVLQTHLPSEELFNIATVGLGVGGDVDGAGRRLLHPQLHSSEDLCKVRKAHGGGEGQGRLPLVAHTLR